MEIFELVFSLAQSTLRFTPILIFAAMAGVVSAPMRSAALEGCAAPLSRRGPPPAVGTLPEPLRRYGLVVPCNCIHVWRGGCRDTPKPLAHLQADVTASVSLVAQSVVVACDKDVNTSTFFKQL